jgi:uncharacterized membrane protein
MPGAGTGYADDVDATTTRQSVLDTISDAQRLDAGARIVDRAASRVVTERRRPLLEGRWLGHALHPLLTDVPLGCWMSAGILDVIGGRSGRRAARRLILAGVVGAVPTVASGLAEWGRITDVGARRTATVHAASGSIATACHAMSWWRRGRHLWRGRAWSLAGTLVSIGTGYLGGHLGLVAGVGGGRRDAGRKSSGPGGMPAVDPLAARVSAPL